MANFRPGISVSSRTAPPPRGQGVQSGTWFVVGAAERGSVTTPRLIRNMTEFETYYGKRTTSSLLWDSLETFFREGGTHAYVMRVIGASGAVAGLTLNDSGAAASLRVDAKNPGTWWNTATVAVTVSGSDFSLTISHPERGQLVKSPLFANQAAAVSWSNSNEWVNVSVPVGASTNDPAALAATALAGGADDYAGVDDNLRAAALAKFTRGLGVGQVSVPGVVSTGMRTALRAHAKDHNRVAFLDVTDAASASTVTTEATALQGDENGALFGPWVLVPGILANTARTVPPSALAAALVARSDQTQSANVAAAGSNGKARFAVGVTQPGWTDAERDALNTAGLNVIRHLPDAVTLYGFRTLAKPDTDVAGWVPLNNQRLRNAITAEAEVVAETFLFDQIDGKGQKVAEFGAALSGILQRHFADGALYGDTPEEAFVVDVGPSTNTPTSLANGELRAVLSVRMSPMAEFVSIEIVKTAVSQSL